MGGLMMNTFNKLRSQVNSGKSMRCVKWSRQVTYLKLQLLSAWFCKLKLCMVPNLCLFQPWFLKFICFDNHTGSRFGYDFRRPGYFEEYGPWYERGILAWIKLLVNLHTFCSPSSGDLQEVDRQVPLMDEIDTKVSSTFISFYAFKTLILLQYRVYVEQSSFLFTGGPGYSWP